jgi:aryl-alcohol dehydrogenase-like predicted oxidoreductase
MKYGRIEGVQNDVSRLVMGVIGQGPMEPLLDEFFQRGGNCFDTAYVYRTQQLLGQWVKDRKVRDQVVILDKGAHTPHCTPEDLSGQILEGLERLQTDYTDIYMMHRDDPAVPIGEFMDVFHEHQSAGRIRAFGGSNWTLERIEAANEYARSKNRAGFAAISNNFSLAWMIEPPWAGCLACRDQRWRQWLTRTQMPLMPWSSQAQGFVAGRADPDDRSNKDLVRCWYSEENFRRVERARQLGERLGVPTVAVALAFVLCQPFPTFPLIGPCTPEETRTSFQALEVELSPQQLAWLDLED